MLKSDVKSVMKDVKTCKEYVQNIKKIITFLVWLYASQYFTQTQQNFLQSTARLQHLEALV